jgi:poly(hydroxyalkanoate) depolymerase family esterase
MMRRSLVFTLSFSMLFGCVPDRYKFKPDGQGGGKKDGGGGGFQLDWGMGGGGDSGGGGGGQLDFGGGGGQLDFGGGGGGTFQAAAWKAVPNFGTNPGNLKVFIHVPPGMPKGSPRPLVVALHGCDMTPSPAQAYHKQSGWSAMADKYKFYVIYPEQQPFDSIKKTGNPARCFNWGGVDVGEPTAPPHAKDNWVRGKGENLSMISMIEYMKKTYSVDAKRIYITGFSGGGAQAILMAALWPDVFEGVGSVEGIAFMCASKKSEVAPCLKMGPAQKKSAQAWGDLVRKAFNYPGKYPRFYLWQGSNDQFVSPANLDELLKQWSNVHKIDLTADSQKKISGFQHRGYQDASGKTVIETLVYKHGFGAMMGHALPVDPDGSGGHAGGMPGMWTKDANIHSTYWIAKFFGLN